MPNVIKNIILAIQSSALNETYYYMASKLSNHFSSLTLQLF